MKPQYKELESKYTKSKYPTEDVQLHSGYDYIVVSAARTIPSVGVGQTLKNFAKSVITSSIVNEGFTEEFAEDMGFGYSIPITGESKGNQYRFINHGLRQLRFFPESSDDGKRVQKTHIVFKQGYTSNDLTRIEEYTNNHGANTVYVDSVVELIQFLNQRKDDNRLIKELIIYSHGVVSAITFHYKGDRVEEGMLDLRHYDSILEEVFDFDAKVVTYGCRNGIAMEGDHFSDGEAGQEYSLAQKMADHLLVDVYAFEKRSIYTISYGDRSKNEDANAANYQKTIDKYEAELSDYRKSVLLGIGVEKPREPEDYEEWIIRMEDRLLARSNAGSNGGPIMKNGAWHEVGTGEFPTGLKEGLQKYIPKDYQ